MKLLHKFTVELEKEVEKTEVTIVDGKEQKLIKKETVSVPHKIALKRLGRGESDTLRLFYGSQIKRAIDNGLMSKAVLINKHIDGAGALISQETAKRMVYLEQTATKFENDLIALGSLTEGDEKRTYQVQLYEKIVDARRELNAIETSNQTIFNNTAENYAQERANLWLIFSQSYIEVSDGKFESLFKGTNFDEREKSYFDLEENEDPLYLKSIQLLMYFWALYSLGRISTPEEFQKEDDRLKAESEERAKRLTEELLAEKKTKEEKAKVLVNDSPDILVAAVAVEAIENLVQT